MSNFYTTTKVPKWRLVAYAILFLGVACGLAIHFGDSSILIGAAIGIPVTGLSILGLYRLARSPGMHRYWSLLIWIYVLAQTALVFWDWFDRHNHHP